MKKLLAAVLSLAMLLPVLCFTATPAAAVSTVVLPTSSAILVNGVNTAFQAYTIGSSNYFKLRDIAMVLSGTGRSFSVDYDAQLNAIQLVTGQPYTPIGGEMTVSGADGRTYADPSTQKVYLDGTLIPVKAYAIGGCNYFKLRDLGTAVNFYVGWDGPSNTITIDTTHEYNIGFFDPTIDYAAQEKYQVRYVTQGYSGSFDALDIVFVKWAGRLNCGYGHFYCGTGNDEIISKLEQYAADGIDGLLIDALPFNIARVKEVLAELKLPWMSCAVAPYTYNNDDTRTQMYPAIELDNTDVGTRMADWAIDYAGKTWPDATADNTGMLSLDYASVSTFHQRTIAQQAVWNAAYPDQKGHFYSASDPAYQATAAMGYSLTKAILQANPSIEYWLICACFDNYAEGAVRAATEMGLNTVTAVTSAGPDTIDRGDRGYSVGSNLIYDWDHAADTCWKSTIFTPQALNAEPMICGLYALMSGKATPETLFLSWINKKAGNSYATMTAPVFMLTQDNYKEYLEWADAYTGFNDYSYANQGTSFPLRSIPPLSYNS